MLCVLLDPRTSEVDEAQSQRLAYHFSARRGVQLPEDRRQVKLDRVLRDRQSARDLTVAQPVRNEHEHVVLSRRELFEQPRRVRQIVSHVAMNAPPR